MTEEMNDNNLEQDEIEIIGSDKYECPNCGAFMVYSPTSQSLSCKYCGSEIAIEEETDEIQEYKLSEAEELADHNWGEEKRVVTCESCSGQTVISITDVTTTCVFCGSSRVVTEDLDEGVRPESMIPFKIDQQNSKEGIKSWVKGKFYAPKALKTSYKLDRLSSLYVPYFTYDSDTTTAFTASRGTYYYVNVTKMVNGKSTVKRERRTRWSNVSGVYNEFFDDLLVNVSSKVEQKLITQMHSFDFGQLVKYNEAFLVGHVTERYKSSLMAGWDIAKKMIDQQVLDGIKRQVNGDEVVVLSRTIQCNDVRFKHILLPIWLTSYEYKEKIYNVYVNGQNGRVVGEYPKSPLKIALTFILFALLIYLIYTFAIGSGGNI